MYRDEIIEEVESLTSLIDESEIVTGSQIKRSESLRQSILKRAYEGKLVAQHPDEPASELLKPIKAEKN